VQVIFQNDIALDFPIVLLLAVKQSVEHDLHSGRTSE